MELIDIQSMFIINQIYKATFYGYVFVYIYICISTMWWKIFVTFLSPNVKGRIPQRGHVHLRIARWRLCRGDFWNDALELCNGLPNDVWQLCRWHRHLEGWIFVVTFCLENVTATKLKSVSLKTFFFVFWCCLFLLHFSFFDFQSIQNFPCLKHLDWTWGLLSEVDSGPWSWHFFCRNGIAKHRCVFDQKKCGFRSWTKLLFFQDSKATGFLKDYAVWDIDYIKVGNGEKIMIFVAKNSSKSAGCRCWSFHIANHVQNRWHPTTVLRLLAVYFFSKGVFFGCVFGCSADACTIEDMYAPEDSGGLHASRRQGHSTSEWHFPTRWKGSTSWGANIWLFIARILPWVFSVENGCINLRGP